MSVQQLFPVPGVAASRALEGLYLTPRLDPAGQGLLYSNFVTSLDGRIALARPGRLSHEVPKAIANPRDWRLFQELCAQADLLITSARFFRQALAHEAQDELPIGPGFGDLLAWRQAQGLAAQPDVAVVSASLHLPVETLLQQLATHPRRLFVVTGAGANPVRRRALEQAGVEVLVAGDGEGVEGRRLRRCLLGQGYRRLYAIAGPLLLHSLLRGQALDRLYLTLAGRLLGGTEFDTLCFGDPLSPPPRLRLASLYLDDQAPVGAGQLLAAYDLHYD